MTIASIKTNFFDWWDKEFGSGLFTFFFSVFMKSVIPVIFLAWLLKRLLVSLMLFPILIMSFVMWEGKTKDSFIHLAILLFPSIKILYLAQNIKKQGYISTRKANLFFVFVTVVFLEVLVLFLHKVMTIMKYEKPFIAIVLPVLFIGLVFIIFESAVIVAFNLIAKSHFRNPNRRSSDLSNTYASKYFFKESDEVTTQKRVDYLKNYGKNVAGHLPLNSDDDIV
jgi:hypothetical protein